jgi:hypothetical protein
MALYKHVDYLTRSTAEIFDQENKPGVAAPRSGIFRCVGCGREVASNQEESLPPRNHHKHTRQQGHIRWRLIVYANHQPST